MILYAISARKFGGKSKLAEMLGRYATDLWPRYDPYTGERRLTPVRRLPMAEPLKEIAVDLFGLPPNLVYGSDEDKEALTDFKWADMPHHDRLVRDWDGLGDPPFIYPFKRLTVRQFLQELGTGVFRRMFSDIFISRWKRHVARLSDEGFDGVMIADDVRFPNELAGCREMEAFCVRLLRGRDGDGHASETSLADDDPLFHLVVDNRDCTPLEAFRQVLVWSGHVSETNQTIALLRAKGDGYGA